MKLWYTLVLVLMMAAGCGKPTPPAGTTEIQGVEISWLVKTNTSIRADYIVADSNYRSVSADEAKSWASKARSELFSARGTQLGDCDDYARKTVEIALDEARQKSEKFVPAIGWYKRNDLSTNHAANIFISNERVVYLLEPQTGEVGLVPYEEGLYVNWFFF